MHEAGIEATRQAYKESILAQIKFIDRRYEDELFHRAHQNEPTMQSPEENFLEEVIRLIESLSRESFMGVIRGINVISGDLIVERLEKNLDSNSQQNSGVERLGKNRVYWACLQGVHTALKNHVRDLRSKQEAFLTGAEQDVIDDAVNRSDESRRTMDSILVMSLCAIRYRSDQAAITHLSKSLEEAHRAEENLKKRVEQLEKRLGYTDEDR